MARYVQNVKEDLSWLQGFACQETAKILLGLIVGLARKDSKAALMGLAVPNIVISLKNNRFDASNA